MRRSLPLLLAALTLLGIVLPSAPLLAASHAHASAVPSGRAQLAHASPWQCRPLKQAPASTALEGTGEGTQSGAETRGGTPNVWDPDGNLIEKRTRHADTDAKDIWKYAWNDAGLMASATGPELHLEFARLPGLLLGFRQARPPQPSRNMR